MFSSVESAILTSLIYITSIVRNQRLKAHNVFLLFFTFLGIGCFLHDQAHAFAFDKYFMNSILIEAKGEKKKELRTKYKENYNFHKEMAKKCYEDAKHAINAFPNFDNKDQAAHCFRAAIATLNPGDPFTKFTYGIITLAGEYGIDVMQDWQRINTLLLMAEIHAQMVEFYALVLNHTKDFEN